MAILMKKKVLPPQPALPERTVEQEGGYICDFCGKQTPDRAYETHGATLRHIDRVSYPEGGHEELQIVDCCSECWQSVVMPWLTEKDITPRKRDINF